MTEPGLEAPNFNGYNTYATDWFNKFIYCSISVKWKIDFNVLVNENDFILGMVKKPGCAMLIGVVYLNSSDGDWREKTINDLLENIMNMKWMYKKPKICIFGDLNTD